MEIEIAVIPMVKIIYYEVPKPEIPTLIDSCRKAMFPDPFPGERLIIVSSLGHDKECPGFHHEGAVHTPIEATTKLPLEGCTCDRVELEITVYKRDDSSQAMDLPDFNPGLN